MRKSFAMDVNPGKHGKKPYESKSPPTAVSPLGETACVVAARRALIPSARRAMTLFAVPGLFWPCLAVPGQPSPSPAQ